MLMPGVHSPTAGFASSDPPALSCCSLERLLAAQEEAARELRLAEQMRREAETGERAEPQLTATCCCCCCCCCCRC